MTGTGIGWTSSKRAVFAAIVFALPPGAAGIETQVSGRVSYGVAYRLEGADPSLLTGLNATAAGLTGSGSGGNADDGNTNYQRGDTLTRALKAYLEFAATEGGFSAFVRVKAWHDFGLLEDARPWGNVANGYAANAPLSDRGAGTWTRFSGAGVQEAWLQQRWQARDTGILLRAGQQNLAWGAGALSPGGLEALNPKDLPAIHRAGAVPQETKVSMPMLFGRVDPAPGLAIEGYWQTAFRPTALDMCGTFWSLSDYMADGCDKVMSGQPAVSDRARLPLGAYMKRLPTPRPSKAEFGLSLQWRAQPGLDTGLYYARYTSRTALPSLRRSTRPSGSPLVPGDPDGRNMAYFTEYPDGLSIAAATFSWKRPQWTILGEASYRPRAPFMLSPGDVLPPFLSATAPALLRSAADAVSPGGLFHGFDLYRMMQAQLGVQHDWQAVGAAWTLAAEVVAKHTPGLPGQAVRRYGRADIFGTGPVGASCAVTTGDVARQCSLQGYSTADAFGYRLRLDSKVAALAPGLAGSTSLNFAHDVKGWSGDLLLNQGRKSAALALRLEYLQRYLAEIGYYAVWGGQYNQVADRDAIALSLGLKF
ncbi:MAG: DUF1302 domain-containing protein [Telluria sp.]